MGNRGKTTIQRFWESYAPYWHICTAFVLFILYVGTFVGLPERVAALEAKVEKIDVLSQQINDISSFLGVPKRNSPYE